MWGAGRGARGDSHGAHVVGEERLRGVDRVQDATMGRESHVMNQHAATNCGAWTAGYERSCEMRPLGANCMQWPVTGRELHATTSCGVQTTYLAWLRGAYDDWLQDTNRIHGWLWGASSVRRVAMGHEPHVGCDWHRSGSSSHSSFLCDYVGV